MVGTRTLHSLAQFLELLDKEMIILLIGKHQLYSDDIEELQYGRGFLTALAVSLRSGKESEVLPLLEEIVRTSRDLRNRVSPHYRFDERFEDLERCLQLDGYIITNRRLVPIARHPMHPGSFDPTKWGAVINYCRSSSFITEEEERGLVGVFGFVSPGSHRPLGFSEGEFARRGRSFVVGMCWFLVKRYRASP
jgi:hypothetical protein